MSADPPASAPELRPDAKLEILDVNVEATVAVRCRCIAAPTFLVATQRPGTCPACRQVYSVKRLAVQLPPRGDDPPIAIHVGPHQSSPIVAPGGAFGVRRN